MYLVVLTKSAEKDSKLLRSAGLERKAKELISIIASSPFQVPPPYEKLKWNLRGSYSRRINLQHRLVYDVLPNDEGLKDETGELYEGVVLVTEMWGHYDD